MIYNDTEPISELNSLIMKIAENVSLWMVHFMSSYYDNDARMPGTVPVDERIFLVAKSYDEALQGAEPILKKLRKKYKENEVKAYPMPTETLIPARDSKNDGRMGWHSTERLQPVILNTGSNQKKYRLAICIVEEK